jgi:hypothetical protein
MSHRGRALQGNLIYVSKGECLDAKIIKREATAHFEMIITAVFDVWCF